MCALLQPSPPSLWGLLTQSLSPYPSFPPFPLPSLPPSLPSFPTQGMGDMLSSALQASPPELQSQLKYIITQLNSGERRVTSSLPHTSFAMILVCVGEVNDSLNFEVSFNQCPLLQTQLLALRTREMKGKRRKKRLYSPICELLASCDIM